MSSGAPRPDSRQVHDSRVVCDVQLATPDGRLVCEQLGVEMVRAGLALALEHGLTSAASELYQRLADALEHAGDYGGATATYDAAFAFCAANAMDPTAQLCLACLTAVLRQTGDWDRAVDLCRQVLAAPTAPAHARTVAAGMLGVPTRLFR